MAKEPQQQTLSIRVPDDLRFYLEHAKTVISKALGETVSISEVAKRLLERAKTDRIEDLIELPELMAQPTESLVSIRRKWEQKRMLARAEWSLLAYYIQQGCEQQTGDLALPSGESLAQLLEAFLALMTVLSKPTKREEYYLRNIDLYPYGSTQDTAPPASIVEAIKLKQQRLRDPRWSAGLLQFSRNLYMALTREEFKSIEALNEVLTPFLPVLFRLAARGHWIAEKLPVRHLPLARDYGFVPVNIPTIKQGDFALSTSMTDQGDLSSALSLNTRKAVYPLSPYSQIHDFWIALKRLQPGEQWTGQEFFAYTDAPHHPNEVTEYYFRHRVNGVIFGFSSEEWRQLGKVFDRFFALAELKPALDELSLQYGEI